MTSPEQAPVPSTPDTPPPPPPEPDRPIPRAGSDTPEDEERYGAECVNEDGSEAAAWKNGEQLPPREEEPQDTAPQPTDPPAAAATADQPNSEQPSASAEQDGDKASDPANQPTEPDKTEAPEMESRAEIVTPTARQTGAVIARVISIDIEDVFGGDQAAIKASREATSRLEDKPKSAADEAAGVRPTDANAAPKADAKPEPAAAAAAAESAADRSTPEAPPEPAAAASEAAPPATAATEPATPPPTPTETSTAVQSEAPAAAAAAADVVDGELQPLDDRAQQSPLADNADGRSDIVDAVVVSEELGARPSAPAPGTYIEGELVDDRTAPAGHVAPGTPYAPVQYGPEDFPQGGPDSAESGAPHAAQVPGTTEGDTGENPAGDVAATPGATKDESDEYIPVYRGVGTDVLGMKTTPVAPPSNQTAAHQEAGQGAAATQTSEDDSGTETRSDLGAQDTQEQPASRTSGQAEGAPADEPSTPESGSKIPYARYTRYPAGPKSRSEQLRDYRRAIRRDRLKSKAKYIAATTGKLALKGALDGAVTSAKLAKGVATAAVSGRRYEITNIQRTKGKLVEYRGTMKVRGKAEPQPFTIKAVGKMHARLRLFLRRYSH